MRGLFAKIFLGFWIAQSLTFLISTVLILRHQFVRPNEMMGVLNATLPTAATAAANAYEAAGCAGLRQFAGSLHRTIYLADTPAHFLCETDISSTAAGVLARASRESGVHSTLVGEQICGVRRSNLRPAAATYFSSAAATTLRPTGCVIPLFAFPNSLWPSWFSV